MKQVSIALYLSNESDKKQIIKQITENNFLHEQLNLNGLKGALHSTLTINRLIEEELQHDHFQIQTPENASLESMSSGQQKKAVLLDLIDQKPDYLILDDLYGNVDKQTQDYFTNTLCELSATTLLIQLFLRKQDLLPCISTVYTVDENNEIVRSEQATDFQMSPSVSSKKRDLFKLPTQYNEKHLEINPLVLMNSVSVQYGEKKVLNQVNWIIQSGEFWQLVGPNGSGKSTLLSLITGDNPKAYGQDLTLFGRKKGSGETIWDIKRQIGYFTPAMVEQFKHNDTVENMIVSGLVDSVGLYTQPTDLQKDIAKNWVGILGDSYKKKMFQSLSIGQQRMVMVARAMVKHPPLLILDEPTIELDDENSSLFIEMIHAIAAEKKIAILYVSHRDEPDLSPDQIFELVPGLNGSTGWVR